jgi:hypothetical protein
MVGMPARREQVAYARRRRLSQRSAAAAYGLKDNGRCPEDLGCFCYNCLVRRYLLKTRPSQG